jgi:predicted membrane-bound spermidine synthase
MFELLGAVIGCLLGIVGPFFYAQIYVARGGDPTAAGALWIVTFITVPVGILIGALIGFIIRLFVKRSKS